METELETKMNILYGLITDIHQANIQILKNQRHLLQQHIAVMMPTKGDAVGVQLVEKTTDTLRMITSGKQ